MKEYSNYSGGTLGPIGMEIHWQAIKLFRLYKRKEKIKRIWMMN
jgi:hypothetical protein